MYVWPKVEQRIEPARKAAQVLHKKLQGCMQSQPGLEAERRMVSVLIHLRSLWKCSVSYWKMSHVLLSLQKKLPLMLLSVSMAESLKDFDAESSIRWQVWSSAVTHPPLHWSICVLYLNSNVLTDTRVMQKPHDSTVEVFRVFSSGWKKKEDAVYDLWPELCASALFRVYRCNRLAWWVGAMPFALYIDLSSLNLKEHALSDYLHF